MHDWRRGSTLHRGDVDGARIALGAALTLFVHVGLPIAWLLFGFVAAAVGLVGPDEPEPPPLQEHVIAARFVTLGRPLDPHQLPDRIVPILRTAPPDPRTAPSTREDPTPPRERVERERRDAVTDVLERLSQDAQQFAEAAERRIPEGDPEGIEEGTERTASEGDLYAGRLMLFFRRGWTVPTTIPRESLRGLVAVARVSIGADLRVLSFSIARSSGDAVFDQSVNEQLSRLVESQSVIPPPPEEVAATYLGQEIAVRFNGRDAR